MKTIVISESAQSKISTKDVTRVTNQVKSKTGKVGSTGKLSHSLMYRITKAGFFIF